MCSDFFKYVSICIVLINITETSLQDCDRCIPIKECGAYMKRLEKTRNVPAKREIFQVLKTRQCGFQNGFPKICCSEQPVDPAQNNGICKTNSTCTILKDCNPYMNFIASLQKPLGRSVVNFLRSQECGFQDGYPKVCCTSIPSNFHTTKRSKPTQRGKFKEPNESIQSLHYEKVTTKPTSVATTKIKRTSEMKKKVEMLNDAFSSDAFDLISFDLMLRKREKRHDSESYVEVEIR